MIDSAKAIGIGRYYDGDVWGLFHEKTPSRKDDAFRRCAISAATGKAKQVIQQ